MSQYVIWDRNAKEALGVFPSNQDALDQLRILKAKSEGRAAPARVLEVLTASDPDYSAGKHDPVK